MLRLTRNCYDFADVFVPTSATCVYLRAMPFRSNEPAARAATAPRSSNAGASLSHPRRPLRNGPRVG
eukprot:15453877-Alexandrium_andersonii.AAC.1